MALMTDFSICSLAAVLSEPGGDYIQIPDWGRSSPTYEYLCPIWITSCDAAVRIALQPSALRDCHSVFSVIVIVKPHMNVNVCTGIQVVRHLQQGAGIPQSSPPKPKATPTAKGTGISHKAGASPAPSPPGSIPAAAAPFAASGSEGVPIAAKSNLSPAKAEPVKPATLHEGKLSRAEAVAAAEAALKSLPMPYKFRRADIKAEVTR